MMLGERHPAIPPSERIFLCWRVDGCLRTLNVGLNLDKAWYHACRTMHVAPTLNQWIGNIPGVRWSGDYVTLFFLRFFLRRTHISSDPPLRDRCVEEVVWDDGVNLLGTGGRLYLDGNLGDLGCNYGVHINTGWWVKLVIRTCKCWRVPALALSPKIMSNTEEPRIFCSGAHF